MDFVLKTMDFVLKTMDFVLKTMDFAYKIAKVVRSLKENSKSFGDKHPEWQKVLDG